jgi:nitrous oxidase accessory protein NosD
MAFNTGNPIGSTDARDLSDNAENFDTALGTTAATWVDRFGVTRDSFEGRLAKGSFYRVGDVATGYTLTNMRQTLEYNGHEYSWAGTFPKVVAAGATPATSGGIGAGAWVDRTDLTLRGELNAYDGQKLIGICPDIIALRAIEPGYDGQLITLKQHTAGTGLGGGEFRAITNGSAYTDNNGTIIKTSGGAVWLRVNADIINPLMFGAIGDGLTNDSLSLNSCFAATLSNDVDLLGLTYNIASTVIYNGACKRRFFNGKLTTTSAITMTRIYSYGHVIDRIDLNGNDIDLSLGIIIDAAAAGSSVINCEIKNTGQSAVVNNASDVIIKDNIITDCGNGASTVGNFRCSIYSNAASRCTFDNNYMTQCRWGIYVREELLNAAVQLNVITNNYIRGNNGLAEADSQGISCQNQSALQVMHNIVTEFGNNGIDMQQCQDCSVQFNRVFGCWDGVFIGDRSCSGHKITHNSIDACNVGVRFYNTPDYPNMIFKGITISDNYIKNCTTYSIFVSLTEATSVNNMTTIDNNHIESSYGIFISGLLLGSVSGNKTYRTIRHGIELTNCTTCHVCNNEIRDASYGSSSYHGIKLSAATSRCLILNNLIYGEAIYGVEVATGCTNNVVTGNRGRSLVVGILNDSGTGTITTVTNSII